MHVGMGRWEGACVVGDMRGRGACMAGGMRGMGGVHGRGEACMAGGCACQGGHNWQGGHVWQGSMHAMHPPHTHTMRYVRSMRGRYASYWNAFLFILYFKLKWCFLQQVEIVWLGKFVMRIHVSTTGRVNLTIQVHQV